MKSIRIKILLLSVCLSSLCFSLYPQDEESSPIKTGADFYSSYIWRGTKLGSGPAVQPVIEYTKGSFTAGAWGSFDFRGYQEVDLYLSFALPAGFTLGITDYYSPDYRYFDYSRATGSHAFEINLGFSRNNLSLEADYILNEAGWIGSVGQDLYFQAEYSFKFISVFIGAGNGWLTYDPVTDLDKFTICNLGFETSREIRITDSFSIPVTGQLIFNPESEQMFIVLGFTL
jgi:hypothetical protein